MNHAPLNQIATLSNEELTRQSSRARGNAAHCEALGKSEAAKWWADEAERFEEEAETPARLLGGLTTVAPGSVAHALLGSVDGESFTAGDLAEIARSSEPYVRKCLKLLEEEGLAEFDLATTESGRVAKFWLATEEGSHVCALLDLLVRRTRQCAKGIA